MSAATQNEMERLRKDLKAANAKLEKIRALSKRYELHGHQKWMLAEDILRK